MNQAASQPVRGKIQENKTKRGGRVGASNGSIRRLCRRGGVRRVNGAVYGEARAVLRFYLKGILRAATWYADHCNRATISTQDVLLALKGSGQTLYGF